MLHVGKERKEEDGDEIPMKKPAPCRDEGLPGEAGVCKYFFYIKEKVSSDWEDLAFHLGFEQPEIGNIAARKRDDSSRCMDLLKEWHKRKGDKATIEVLMEALSKANLQSVVDGLEKKFAGSPLPAEGPSSPSSKDPSVVIHSIMHSKTTVYILAVVVVLCGVGLQASLSHGVNVQITQQSQTEMTGKDQTNLLDQTSQQTDQTLLQRVTEMTEEMKQLQKKIETLEQRNYIKRCESGVIDLPDGFLGTKRTERTMERTAMFNTAFDTKPVVTIGLIKVDHVGDVRIKVDIVPESIKATGFKVAFTNWNEESKLYSASVYWMACA